jgi:hypothetical protein
MLSYLLPVGIACILLFGNVTAQSYFSKRYDLLNEQGYDFSLDIVGEISGYTLVAQSEGMYTPNGLIAFLTIDNTGNISGVPVSYYDSVSGIQTGYPGSFIKKAGGNGYFCLATKMKMVPAGRYDRGWLMYLDSALDTIWTKMYTDAPPHDTSIMFRNFRELNEGGFIVVSLLNPVPGGLFRIGMHKIDSTGTLLWGKRYGTGNIHFQGVDVSSTSDSGYVIGAEFIPAGGSSSQDTDPIIIKTNSIGNQQWSLHLGNPDCRDNYAMVGIANDGNIQVGTEYSDTYWSESGYKARINFLKIRNDKSIVWDNKYGFPKVYLNLSKVRVLPDSDVIGTGWYYDFSLNGMKIISWIIRTDSAGNEKWYREYSLLKGPNSQNLLWNVIPTNDGGFAACGMVVPVQPDTGTQDSWVLKVDSLGCESPGNCWVGQDEIEVKTFTPDKPFVVYPNPATDRLTVEFHSNPDGAMIALLNIYGQCCTRINHPKNTERAHIDISKLPRGIYFVRVTSGDRVMATEKVVVR